MSPELIGIISVGVSLGIFLWRITDRLNYIITDRLNDIDLRLARVEGIVEPVRNEVVALRADVVALRSDMDERFKAVDERFESMSEDVQRLEKILTDQQEHFSETLSAIKGATVTLQRAADRVNS